MFRGVELFAIGRGGGLAGVDGGGGDGAKGGEDAGVGGLGAWEGQRLAEEKFGSFDGFFGCGAGMNGFGLGGLGGEGAEE